MRSLPQRTHKILTYLPNPIYNFALENKTLQNDQIQGQPKYKALKEKLNLVEHNNTMSGIIFVYRNICLIL